MKSNARRLLLSSSPAGRSTLSHALPLEHQCRDTDGIPSASSILKVDLGRLTPFTEDCVRFLAERPEHKSDEILAAIAQVRIIGDGVAHALVCRPVRWR